MTRALALAVLALGCQGTSGGIPPDARELDAAIDPCADMIEWSTREPLPIAPHRAGPLAIAVDDAYAYWTEPVLCDLDGGCQPGPIVSRAPLAGGDPEQLFVGQSEIEQPGALAVTRDYLFVVIGGQLWRSQKDGTAPEIVGAAGELAADADAIYFWQDGQLTRLAADTLEETPVGAAEMQLATDLQLAGDAAWWLEPQAVDIWRMPLATGIAELSAQIEGGTADSLAVDGASRAFLVTWTANDPETPPVLVRTGGDGTAAEPIAELLDGIHDVVVDDTHVYWLEPNAGRLSRVPVDGGCVETLALENQGSTAMASAADGIVVASAGSIALVER
jgi:hypothetical protein